MAFDARINNFNMVRLLAAFLIMAGHMGSIMGNKPPVFGSEELQNIGVKILFLIGGYLVSKSWRNDPHFGRYFIRRFLRLYPPFAVMILMMAYVAGPAVSNLGREGYFNSWWTSWLGNLRFYIVFAQPGVFEHAPMPLVTNGSLWTMPVEALLYILNLVILIPLYIFKDNRKTFTGMAVLVVILCCIDLFFCGNKGLRIVFYNTNWAAAYYLIVYYVIGMLCSFEEMRRFFSLQFTPFAVLAILLTTEFCYPQTQEVVWLIALPYLVFSMALAKEPVFWHFGSKFEISYGIYLYGFFFQQLVFQWCMEYKLNWSYMSCLALSLMMTIPAAFLSCVLIEKPCLQLSKYICKLWKRKTI